MAARAAGSPGTFPSTPGVPSRRRAITLALAAVLAHGCGGSSGSAPRQPNVLIWMVDTLRADRLSAYGYERPTSPHMARLAEQGVRFDQFHVGANWTQPSVASMLSGLDPPPFDGGFAESCPPELFLAAEAFQLAGYQTVGLTVTVATAARFGFDQGFDSYRELDAEASFGDRKHRSGALWDAALVVDETLAWLDAERDPERPAFLYLHTIDPHVPYESHPELGSFSGDYDGPMDGQVATIREAVTSDYAFTDADKAHLSDLYDDEVRYNDAEFGRLLAGLAERGLAEDTLVVVVGDHGEEFWEHGDRGHSKRNLHSELTRVPWLLRWPAGLAGGQRIDAVTRGVDVLPTLLELAGVPQVVAGHGRSLAPALRGPSRPAAPAALDPARAYIARCKGEHAYVAVRSEERLLTYDAETGEHRLYAWRDDPAESRDLSADEPEVARALLSDLLRWTAERTRAGGTTQLELDDETRARLEALGYLR